MRIYNINPIKFTGQRKDRKTVAQLKQDNDYDLNLMNQRNISQAIENLSENAEEDNIKFLIDVTKNLKYGTNIDLGKKSYNDWREKLLKAIEKSASQAPDDVQTRLSKEISQLKEIQPLTKTEEEIIEQKKKLLEQIDIEELNNIPNKNIKNLSSNLDYFIISSEVPTVQKLYILKRLNHFMSDEYKINPQLADKKTQALAEIVNDIVIDTPASEIPNIKAVNQRQHGMCAAISICRKALAYEDKPNFVDMIMSELDENPYMMVYDISKLGTHTKIKTPKTYVDFDYAISRGYRIIDASALYWMHIADTEFSQNEVVGMYSAFDKEFFDTFHDSHLLPNFKDEDLSQKQDYYRSLIKAKNAITAYKIATLIKDYKNKTEKTNKNKKIDNIRQYNKRLDEILHQIAPDSDFKTRHQIITDLKHLEVKDYDATQKVDDYKKDFVYLPQESNDVKAEKIRAFITIALDSKNTKLLNKNISEIVSLVEDINDLTKNKNHILSHESKEIMRAKALYEAAAAYRTTILTRLDIPDELLNIIINSGIKDRESRIADNLEELAQRYELAAQSDESKSKFSKIKQKKARVNEEISQTLAQNFQTENDPEILAIALRENKKTLDYIMNDLLDDFYKASLSVSRKNVLKDELEIIKKAIEADNNETLDGMAKNLQIEPNKKLVLEQLNEYIDVLSSDSCTNEQYIKIYNNVGKRNQMQDCADNFKQLYEALFIKKDKKIIENFNRINGHPANIPLEETLDIYNDLAEKFNTTAMMTTALQNALEIRSKDGKILNTVIDKEIIIKELENAYDLISQKDLQTLQTHFNKIDSLLSSYSGERMKAKDLPKELRTFTPHEQEVLTLIEANLTPWYKKTKRALNVLYKQIEEPLSELNRKVGVKTGHFAVWLEGESGLFDRQQVKIIEHMTDRPYYIEENTRLALDKIKESPYSGISSTSVDHKSPAYHAQYIADVKTISVKDKKGETQEKEAVFHDNTWGPSEHENIWTDRDGMLRTDYAREFGGVNGYITDDKYLSGKLSDNMIGKVGIYKPTVIDSKKYKHLAGSDNEEYKYPMFSSVITNGKSPLANSHVTEIRQSTLINPLWYFDDLTDEAAKMSYYEVKETINKVKTISNATFDEYDKIEKRVFGQPPFDKGIKTQKDYNKLPDDDPVKILFEQIAILKSYSDIPDTKIFYKQYSIMELGELKEKIRKDARKNFAYTFGKNRDIAIYGAERSRKMLSAVLDNFAKENNIEINPTQKIKIINSLKTPDQNNFDGRLTQTTVLMSDSFAKYLSLHTPDFENKQEKINLLKEDVQKYLYKNMVFTETDVNDPHFKNGKLKHVSEWIDRTFNPKTDEEYAQIFKNLQEMSTKEFNKKYESTITDTDLGIKQLTGYDILKRFRAMDERTYNSVINTLYGREVGKALDLTPTKPSYDYNKFEKVLRGAIFEKGKRTFDDIYYDYYWSLYMLTVQDKYSKWRKNLFEQYGVFPAYPKIEYKDENEVIAMVQDLYKDIKDSINTIDLLQKQDLSISIVKDLYEFISEYDNSAELSKEQKDNIKENIQQFISINEDDESRKDILKAANNILKLPDDATVLSYKRNIETMWDEISMFERTIDGKTSKESIADEHKNLRKTINNFVKNNFPAKYQDRAKGILYKYIQAKMTNKKNADDIFEPEFTDLFDKHYMFKHPEEILNEYLLLICKSKEGEKNPATHDNIKNLKAQIKQLKEDDAPKSEIKALEDKVADLEVKEEVLHTYKTLLQSALISGNVLELEYILMDCAQNANLNIVRDEYKTSTVQLKDGRVMTLDSSQALNMILLPLIIGNNLDTTMKFTEELNLQEGVARMLIDSSKIDKVRQYLARIDRIYTAISKQTQYVQDELKTLEDIDNDPNYIERINKAKKNILKKSKNTGYKNGCDNIEHAFKKVLEDIEAKPNLSKIALLHLHMDTAKQASIYLATDDVQELNNQLMKFQYIENFARMLAPKLQEGTQIKADFDKFLEKLNELDEFAMSHSKDYPLLDIHTRSADNPY